MVIGNDAKAFVFGDWSEPECTERAGSSQVFQIGALFVYFVRFDAFPVYVGGKL